MVDVAMEGVFFPANFENSDVSTRLYATYANTIFRETSCNTLKVTKTDKLRDETDEELRHHIDTKAFDTLKQVVGASLQYPLASVGSIAGSLLSFFICRAFPGVCGLSGPDAAQAAACLAASSIG
jgi:hypothetical protein